MMAGPLHRHRARQPDQEAGRPGHLPDLGLPALHRPGQADRRHGADPRRQPSRVYSNPLPHVLILTAIVVGVATLALGLALVVRIREAYGTIEEDEILDAGRDAETCRRKRDDLRPASAGAAGGRAADRRAAHRAGAPPATWPSPRRWPPAGSRWRSRSRCGCASPTAGRSPTRSAAGRRRGASSTASTGSTRSCCVLVSAVAAVVLPYSRASIAAGGRAASSTTSSTRCSALCLAGLLGITITGDAFNLFVFLEISSLSTYVLIALGQRPASAVGRVPVPGHGHHRRDLLSSSASACSI